MEAFEAMVLLAECSSLLSQGLDRLLILEEEVYFNAFEDSLVGHCEELKEFSHSLSLHEDGNSGGMLRKLLNHLFIN